MANAVEFSLGIMDRLDRELDMGKGIEVNVYQQMPTGVPHQYAKVLIPSRETLQLTDKTYAKTGHMPVMGFTFRHSLERFFEQIGISAEHTLVTRVITDAFKWCDAFQHSPVYGDEFYQVEKQYRDIADDKIKNGDAMLFDVNVYYVYRGRSTESGLHIRFIAFKPEDNKQAVALALLLK